MVERMRERENQPDMVDIDAVIYCERDNHKGIIIGKKGSMLKRVGSYAREDMERFLTAKCNLQLWVKSKRGLEKPPAYFTKFRLRKNRF